MACFSPLKGYRPLAGGPLSFGVEPKDSTSISVACGQCIGCRLDRARMWSLRCMHEASLHEDNCFLTLTYSDENLPQYGSLNHRDFQLFFKRLRKSAPARYYMCGEYGEQFKRPHFHACVFGFNFNDRKLFSNRDGIRLYTSDHLSSLWPHGFATVGDLTLESANYVARYVLKKVTGSKADSHYSVLGDVDFSTGELIKLQPEYNACSTKPGIGADWFRKFESDVVVRDSVISAGHRFKMPRYYEKLMLRSDTSSPIESELRQLNFEALKSQRLSRFSQLEDNSSPERLAVRRAVLSRRLERLHRGFEKEL